MKESTKTLLIIIILITAGTLHIVNNFKPTEVTKINVEYNFNPNYEYWVIVGLSDTEEQGYSQIFTHSDTVLVYRTAESLNSFTFNTPNKGWYTAEVYDITNGIELAVETQKVRTETNINLN